MGNIINPLKSIPAMAFLLLILCCNQTKDKSEITGFEEKPIAPQARKEIAVDTSVLSAEKTEPPAVQENKSYPKPSLKICQPNFNLIGKPKSNRYLFYVTGFNPGEFKCWAELEAHGVEICKGEPCVIYYLDTPKVSLTSTAPHYVDLKVLAEHGIGQFEHTSHWWEVKGAKLWGNRGKEFTYYNTNNNAGG